MSIKNIVFSKYFLSLLCIFEALILICSGISALSYCFYIPSLDILLSAILFFSSFIILTKHSIVGYVLILLISFYNILFYIYGLILLPILLGKLDIYRIQINVSTPKYAYLIIIFLSLIYICFLMSLFLLNIFIIFKSGIFHKIATRKRIILTSVIILVVITLLSFLENQHAYSQQIIFRAPSESNAIENGIDKFFHMGNTLILSTEYKNGKKNGLEILYYGDNKGTKMYEISYHNNKIFGHFTTYDIDGNVLTSGKVVDGFPIDGTFISENPNKIIWFPGISKNEYILSYKNGKCHSHVENKNPTYKHFDWDEIIRKNSSPSAWAVKPGASPAN